MTKSSKLIATLGVVAGLGVAALPLGSVFASETVSGNVQVEVEVQPAIAMTISGNNDAAGSANYTYKAIEATVGETTVTGKYELSEHAYTATSDTTAVEGKTYYEKVQVTKGEIDNVFAPAGAAGKTLNGHTISATQDTDTSSSRIALLPYSLVEGDRSAQTPQNSFGSTITVYTNNKTGFTLNVKDFDANTDLSHVDGDAYIPASNETLVAGTAGWNYDTTLADNTGTTDAKTHAAITAGDVAIDTFGSKTSGGRATIVDYNVATSADQATGIYTDTIVYTATTNN